MMNPIKKLYRTFPILALVLLSGVALADGEVNDGGDGKLSGDEAKKQDLVVVTDNDGTRWSVGMMTTSYGSEPVFYRSTGETGGEYETSLDCPCTNPNG